MRTKATAIGAALAALALVCALFAASASANPSWEFEEKALSGSEVVLGGAYESAMTVPGLTTSCENFLYELSIENGGSGGEGDLTDMPLFNCYTDSDACFVEAIQAEGLPWNSHLTTVKTTPYIVFEEAEVSILYEGEECVLAETLVPVTGSAGGSINNKTESATFNAETLKATGTELRAFGQAIEWLGVFPTEAFEGHREEAISVS